MTSQREIAVMIAEQAMQLGSLTNALRVVRDAVPRLIRESGDVHDLFPRHPMMELTGKLCRCRGMIQEVRPDASLFCASSDDFFSENHGGSEPEPEYLDAVDLYVVPVPGNSHFYVDNDPEFPQVDAASIAHEDPQSAEAQSAYSPRKRPLRDECAPQTAEKRARIGDAPEASGEVIPPPLACDAVSLNLPHRPTRPGLQTACIVTVITPREGDTRELFRTNDVLDFYGYLHAPTTAQCNEEEDDELLQFSAWGAAELPHSLVSRLLCVAYEPVGLNVLREPLAPNCFAEARDYALRYLTLAVCGGDELLGNFLLLHLCSRVSAHNPVTPIGDVPLLVCSPSLSAAAVSRGIAAVAPVSEVLLTAHDLRAGAQPLAPRHDSKRNVLQTGTLQVANGTHITIDCCGLGADEPWSDTLFAAIHKQQLILDYPYQKVELPINVAYLAVCTSLEDVCTPFDFGLRIVSPALKIPVAPEEQSEQEAAFTISSGPVRDYLTRVQQVNSSFGDAHELQKQISDSLVELSTEQPLWNNRDPLVHNNSFSIAAALLRAIACSHGRSDIQENDLHSLLDLERRRIARNSS